MVPAPGQGTLAIEARAGPTRGPRGGRGARRRNRHAVPARRARAGGSAGCDLPTPVGAHADESGDGLALTLHAFVGLPDGSQWARDSVRGPAGDPEALGRECAGRLLGAGAGELLRRAEEVAA